jgi:type I restriction enzyme S subunit
MELTLKEGYKQTEIGIIPKDWETIKIGDSLLFKNGLNKESEFFGYGTPIINYMDVFKNFGLTKSDIKGKVFLNSQELNNFSARKGDVFFTRTSETQEEIGVSAVLLENIDNCVFSGFVLRGRPVNKKVASEYFQYCFIPDYVRTQIIAKSSFTTRALTNGRYLSKVTIALPPTLEEQKTIATALSDVDHLISNLDDLIAKKKAIKQGAMQQLLTPPSKGGKRLNGFDGEWLEKSLGDVAKYKNGAAHENCVVKSGDFIIVNSKFVSTEGRVAKYSNENRCPVYKDDILMVLSDVPNGKAIAKCFYVEQDNRYTLNQRICAFTSTDLDSKFLFLLLNRNSYFLLFDDGVKQTNLRNDDVLNCPLIIPPTSEEQKAIAQILSDMDKELEELATKKEKYEHIKQGMMQELLTGKTRLI